MTILYSKMKYMFGHQCIAVYSTYIQTCVEYEAGGVSLELLVKCNCRKPVNKLMMAGHQYKTLTQTVMQVVARSINFMYKMHMYGHHSHEKTELYLSPNNRNHLLGTFWVCVCFLRHV